MEKKCSANRSRQTKRKASTQDILGLPAQDGRIPRKWAEHHRTLTELRDRFSGSKTAQSANAKQEISGFGEHIADAATDSYDRDWALAMLSSDQNALYEIDQALERIAEGTYGHCELTGKPIEAARLKAIPWTRFSAEAQADLETRGLSVRTHLGELGTWSQAGDSERGDLEEVEETAPAGRGRDGE